MCCCNHNSNWWNGSWCRWVCDRWGCRCQCITPRMTGAVSGVSGAAATGCGGAAVADTGWFSGVEASEPVWSGSYPDFTSGGCGCNG